MENILASLCGGILLVIVAVFCFVLFIILPLGTIGMTILTLIGSVWSAIVGGNK